MMPVWLEVILTAAVVVAAAASAVAAWFALGIARRQTEPQVLVMIEPLVEGSPHHALSVRNVGSSPAFQVSANLDTSQRKIGEPGVWAALCALFPLRWSRIDPGKVKSFLLDVDGLWQERNSGAELIVEVAYSTRAGKKPNRTGSFEVTPTWVDGELMRGPGVWRELDTRIQPFRDSITQINQTLQRIADSLDDKDDE